MAVGTGSSSVKHACDVGAIYGSHIFQCLLLDLAKTFLRYCTFSLSLINGTNFDHPSEHKPWLRKGLDEKNVHNAACKAGLAFNVELEYVQVPVANADGSWEVMQWPILLPHKIVSWLMGA